MQQTKEVVVEEGIKVVPAPILQHIQRCIKGRPSLPHVYHVTDLLYCLRKEYFKRKTPTLKTLSEESAFNIYRGQTFDHLWSCLFDRNQETFVIQRNGITITGTFDFVYEENGEHCLYDLKMPASTYYKKQYGAGVFYHQQVQAYLAMMHENNVFLNVQKAHILMIAETFIRETVLADDKTIIDYLWIRAFELDQALMREQPKSLTGPEAKWECDPKYCSFTKQCKNGVEKHV